MQQFVTELLKNKIPTAYSYHNYKHTLYVQEKAKQIALHEKLDARECFLIDAAALWHDVGYIHKYQGHEEESCILAKKYLPTFGYHQDQIDNICALILATKISHHPTSILEKIMADADIAYLGTSYAEKLSKKLFEELHYIHPHLTPDLWQQQQINFISSHHYYTNYCKLHFEPDKQQYLKKLNVANMTL